MDTLGFYIKEGIHHITDPKGFDHMLFVITLCAFYHFDQMKKLLVLVTAFTIGHTVTLALSTFDIVKIDQKTIEFLIPITILLTSIYNISFKSKQRSNLSFNYILALFFGLIHGMGFSNYFRSMMMGISDNSIALPLFGFNLGIEIGQLFIVIAFMAILFFYTHFFRGAHRDWKLFFSGGGAALSISMILNQL